ncbi:MAG: hypothetical protein KatS3mg124_0070 [Porticoccaceae bacterium]|nr:MAG: hypothetical protein KatS3mg124_0070 [Porticoccaceae bacterium]
MLVETAGERILLPGGELRWWPAFLSPERAGCAFRALRRRAHWERSRIRIAGRWLEVPRLNAWYGEPGREYGYSGTRLVRRPFFPRPRLVARPG